MVSEAAEASGRVRRWPPGSPSGQGDRGGLAKRMCLTVFAAACVILTFSACGGGDGSKTEVVRLKSAPPIAFLKIEGPAGAVGYITDRLAAAAFAKDQVGVVAPPAHYPRPRCSFTHTISSSDAPDLRRWRGKKVRIAVYDSAGPFCQVLKSYIYRTSS